ncbi:MAG TPA: (2Fe-2S)-binding protein, partial [candidate division Zixibacteria bacterium]|nr:(2Fe-2S)-binding protein [candidate division Zixibacteria bacterium]
DGGGGVSRAAREAGKTAERQLNRRDAEIAERNNNEKLIANHPSLITGRERPMSAVQRAISFTLNGERVSTEVPAHWNLVELLQNRFGLFGARESCAQGLCGCCTVLVNGRAVSGCLYLAALVDGAEVATIEQPAEDGGLDQVQKAFIEAGGFQCGFCTPGFVLMTRQLLDENPDPTEDEIRHYLSGNLCRCATYPEIIKAVQLAARMRK